MLGSATQDPDGCTALQVPTGRASYTRGRCTWICHHCSHAVDGLLRDVRSAMNKGEQPARRSPLRNPERPASSTSAVAHLTHRQREIVELISRGLTNEDIGRVLGISPTTVRTHVTAILATLEVDNRTEAAAVFIAESAQPAAVEAVMLRPALVVLPFGAGGNNPREQALARGITADLSSVFSRWCIFPVLASPRSAEDTRPFHVWGQELGARYAVGGTVRLGEGENTCRIHFQLVDVSDGRVVWVESHDVAVGDIRSVMDTLCQQVVAACYPLLLRTLHKGLGQARARVDMDAWELAHRGMALQGQRERSANAEATRFFQAALSKDPTLVLAHFGLGLCAYDQVLNQWVDPVTGRELLQRCAHECIALAPHAAEGHYLLGRHHQTMADHESAVRALEKAVGRNPSFAPAHALMAQALLLIGRTDEALARMSHAQRLDPQAYVAGLATLHFARGEFPAALDSAERAVALTPSYPYARAMAAVAAFHLGSQDRARQHLRILRTQHPEFTAEQFERTFGPQNAVVARFSSTLRSLGLRGLRASR